MIQLKKSIASLAIFINLFFLASCDGVHNPFEKHIKEHEKASDLGQKTKELEEKLNNESCLTIQPEDSRSRRGNLLSDFRANFSSSIADQRSCSTSGARPCSLGFGGFAKTFLKS